MTTFSRSPARLKGLAALVIGGLALSACATTPMGGSAVGPAVFNADDFAWSTRHDLAGRGESRLLAVAPCSTRGS